MPEEIQSDTPQQAAETPAPEATSAGAPETPAAVEAVVPPVPSPSDSATTSDSAPSSDEPTVAGSDAPAAGEPEKPTEKTTDPAATAPAQAPRGDRPPREPRGDRPPREPRADRPPRDRERQGQPAQGQAQSQSQSQGQTQDRPKGGNDRRGGQQDRPQDRPQDRSRDAGRGDRRPDQRRPEGPIEIEYDKLVADSLYLDNQAHVLVARLRDLDAGTRSQLRRLYGAVRRACRAVEGDRQHQFVMLRARLAYTIARHGLRSLDPLEKLLLQVTRRNETRGYDRFRDLFEAIIAYNE